MRDLLIVCDECFMKRGCREEKACTHGMLVNIECVDCGKKRLEFEELEFHCLGYLGSKP
jgi:hypothetical protein